MIQPMPDGETIEMPDYYNANNPRVDIRYPSNYHDSFFLKAKVCWWNMPKKKRLYFIGALLLFLMLLILVIMTICMQPEPSNFQPTEITVTATMSVISTTTETVHPTPQIMTTAVTNKTSVSTQTSAKLPKRP
ncbi:unnamed protein product [Gongylonema pulchrum]|uniref:CLLAC domain-containing protein n=1 Tax=Gongylonema pulchrum TaxID=637853 RepID=A0A183CW85_9BILA|nr:unnamed protein product [Gongylonema pulchrum]